MAGDRLTDKKSPGRVAAPGQGGQGGNAHAGRMPSGRDRPDDLGRRPKKIVYGSAEFA